MSKTDYFEMDASEIGTLQPLATKHRRAHVRIADVSYRERLAVRRLRPGRLYGYS